MASAPRTIDVTDNPDLRRLVEELQDTDEAATLRCEGKDVAVVTPLRPGKRGPKGRPVSRNSPLWEIVGTAKSDGPTDVSSNKHKYLAEAYLSHTE